MKKNNEVLMNFLNEKVARIMSKFSELQIENHHFQTGEHSWKHENIPKNFQKVSLQSKKSPLRGFQTHSFFSLSDSFSFEEILLIHQVLKAPKNKTKIRINCGTN